MIGDLVHQSIGRLRIIQLVEVHVRTTCIVAALRLFRLLPGLQRITIVIDTGAVPCPRDRVELAELEEHRQIDAVGHATEVPGVPVGAAIGQRVGQQVAIRARHPLRQGDGGVVALAIRVHQHARRCIERIADIKDALILRAIVAHEEIFAAFTLRDPEAFIRPELFETFAEPGSLRQLFEIGLCQCIFCGNPVARCLCRRILEPAIRIGHAHAVIHVDHFATRGRGIGKFWRSRFRHRRRGWRARCRAGAEQCGQCARGKSDLVARIVEHP
jgi:hypothetical protein